MKGLNSTEFLFYGQLLRQEYPEAAPPFTTYSPEPGTCFRFPGGSEALWVKPVAGVGYLQFRQGTEEVCFLLDRTVVLNPHSLFCICPCGSSFQFEAASFALCLLEKTDCAAQQELQPTVQNIQILLHRQEEQNCLLPGGIHNFYELTYLEAGHLFQVIDGQTYLLGPGELQFFLPNQPHRQYGYREESAVFFTIIFDAALVPGKPLTNKIFSAGTQERHLISELQEAAAQNRIYKEALCQSCLSQLLILLLRRLYELPPLSPAGNDSGSNAEIVRNAIKLLAQSPAVKASTLAKKLGISAPYLSRLVSRQTGKSITEWRTELRMESAKELLRGGHSVGAAASALQYPSTAYFSSEFSRYIGMSPRTYARQFDTEEPGIPQSKH